MKTIMLSGQENYTKAFLKLPYMLYKENERLNNRNEELELLSGTHVLSHYFTVKAFLAVDDNLSPLARCIVTIYPDDPKAYIGLFEAQNNISACTALFKLAHEYCLANNKLEVVGPVDASVWIGYRFKCNNFGTPYTGEPYNMPYYKEIFEHLGYSVDKLFISNIYEEVQGYVNKKAKKRLEDKLAKGYIIKSPDMNNLDKELREVFRLLSELYSDFPAYKQLTEDEFVKLFYKMRYIADFSMLKTAYYKNELVGFFIALPNFGSILCGNMTPLKFLKLQWVKRHTKEFIMLYLGVQKGHEGLGVAITQLVLEENAKRKLKFIGALIQDGKATGSYFGDKMKSKTEYVLMHKFLTKSDE